LLGRAEHIVERQHDPNLANHVELLISIGQKYQHQDEDAKAHQLFEEAYQLSRVLKEQSTRAKASCALGNILVFTGEPGRAESLIQEGLRELPDEPHFVLDRVFCLRCGREVADHNGAPQEAITRVQLAQRILKDSPLRSQVLELHVSVGLAEAYREAEQFREATATFEHAAALLSALGRDDTETAGTLLNNWALTMWSAGQPLQGEQLFRRAIDISRDNQGEQAVSPMLLVNYAHVLRDLARLSEAADYAERAGAKAQQAGDQVVIYQSLIERARIYRGQGDLGRAKEMLDQAGPRLRRDVPVGHYTLAVLSSERALNAEAAGDLRTALELANQAISIVQAAVKGGGAGAEFMPILLDRRSDIEHRLGRADDAAMDAAQALSQLQANSEPGTLSSELGRAYLTLGRALQAQGKADEAHAAFHTAAENFEKTLGPAHPDTLTARRLGEVDIQHE
jgi:tetratricopeptide (TPR) repeat protein